MQLNFNQSEIKNILSKNLLVLFLLFFSFSLVRGNPLTKNKLLVKIEQQIEKGELVKAEKKLLYLEKSRKASFIERYYYSKLLGKIYLTQQAFSKYSLQVEKSVKFARKTHPIYQAEAFANKAYYWHYMMWPDSALVYSNKSMTLYRKHEKFRAKIDVPFIYEIYAMTYLYRSDKTKPIAYLEFDINDSRRKQFQYFDSALYYQEKYPFKFTTDRAMLYRSYGNRWLDMVSSYQIFTKKESEQFKPLQWIAFHRANELYDKGLACLKKCHKNDFVFLTALKGTNHTCVGKWQEADAIFDAAMCEFSSYDLLNPSNFAYQTLMDFLSIKIRNTILLPYNRKEINKEIALLESLKLGFWKSFQATDDLPYDSYKTSPYVNLFSLYTFKSLHEPNGEKHFKKAVSYLLTMKSYFNFLQNSKEINPAKLPFLDVNRIQKRLKKNECYLFMFSDSDYLKNRRILITNTKIQFVKSYNKYALTSDAIDTLSVQEFKRLSIQDYRNTFESVLRIIPSVKKVYISYDDVIPYELLVKDTTGNTFSNLKYFGKHINFVRIYNPYTYFDKPVTSPMKQFDVRFLKLKGTSKLLFMTDFFNNYHPVKNFSKENYTGNLKNLLKEKGILHLFGHGELAINVEANTRNFQFSYQNSGKHNSVTKLTGNFKVNRDLVVLNNCFSGFPLFIENQFNKTIQLRIMSNGAKALIGSPSKVDDYYSAELFKLFYAKIEAGMYYEDAFFEAKQTFFKEHAELSQPNYWNGLQLIQSYKVRNEALKSNPAFVNWWLLSAFLDMLLMLLYVLLKKRLGFHRSIE